MKVHAKVLATWLSHKLNDSQRCFVLMKSSLNGFGMRQTKLHLQSIGLVLSQQLDLGADDDE